jgi:hypothetical protein
MKSVAIVLAAWFVTGPLAMLPALAGFDDKAAHHAAEQQRKAAEAEMRRQADYEKKLVEQQNRAMQEQMKAQQKFVENQQRLAHEQQKAIQNQQKTSQNAQNAHSATTTGTASHAVTHQPQITTTQTTTPVYHAARPYYGHTSGHAYHRTYHTYRTGSTRMPVDPQTRAFQRLKSSLDHVRMGSPVTAAERTAIKRALMGVVNVPKVPTVSSIQTLANNLADGLANRGASIAQTAPMAMTLMGALNSTELANNEVIEVLNEHRSTLKNSRVRTTEITPIMESLKVVSNQERYRH